MSAPEISKLLDGMRLAEKVGQLNMPLTFEGDVPAVADAAPRSAAEKDAFVKGTHRPHLGPGGGFFGLASGMSFPKPGGPGEQAAYHNHLQVLARTKTRHGIPLLQIAEGTHGVMSPGATVFPEGPALGSTWDPPLIRRVFAAVAREARALGVHLLCTLLAEPIRDPRLGRSCEAFAEDVLLTSKLVDAVVRGVQEDGSDGRVGAVLCHFPGQSEPEGGLERGAMHVSERALRSVFLPAWKEVLSRSGAYAVMATYPAIDDEVTHGSRRVLTELLRDELGFVGIVLSEGFGFETLEYEGIVATSQEAGVLAIDAGVDVNITWEDAYLKGLVDAVDQGLVPVQLVDRAVARVLDLKMRLGLFDDPLVDAGAAGAIVGADEHVQLALETAREGIVLLKNRDGLLPLSRETARVAVIGPNADDSVNQLGDYTTENVLQPVVTILEGVRSKLGPSAEVTYAKGCAVTGFDRSGIAEAVAAAQGADVAIVVVGEQVAPWSARRREPTVGEGADVASLDLSGLQDELLQAVHATGKPTIVVLINGRALSIRWAAEHVPAIVEAWFPGERGGEAVADVLFGDHNPSGRLPVTIPRHVGQLPLRVDYRPSRNRIQGRGAWGGYVDLEAGPLFEFGFGLSYTTFMLGEPRVSAAEIPAGADVSVALAVTNTGRVAGAEVVQLYVRDVVSSLSRPAKQLRQFQKVVLQPGESRTVRFELTAEDFALLDRSLRWAVEPGAFELLIGRSSERIDHVVRVVVTGTEPYVLDRRAAPTS